jgi:hypothetical protein
MTILAKIQSQNGQSTPLWLDGQTPLIRGASRAVSEWRSLLHGRVQLVSTAVASNDSVAAGKCVTYAYRNCRPVGPRVCATRDNDVVDVAVEQTFDCSSRLPRVVASYTGNNCSQAVWTLRTLGGLQAVVWPSGMPDMHGMRVRVRSPWAIIGPSSLPVVARIFNRVPVNGTVLWWPDVRSAATLIHTFVAVNQTALLGAWVDLLPCTEQCPCYPAPSTTITTTTTASTSPTTSATTTTTTTAFLLYCVPVSRQLSGVSHTPLSLPDDVGPSYLAQIEACVQLLGGLSDAANVPDDGSDVYHLLVYQGSHSLSVCPFADAENTGCSTFDIKSIRIRPSPACRMAVQYDASDKVATRRGEFCRPSCTAVPNGGLYTYRLISNDRRQQSVVGGSHYVNHITLYDWITPFRLARSAAAADALANASGRVLYVVQLQTAVQVQKWTVLRQGSVPVHVGGPFACPEHCRVYVASSNPYIESFLLEINNASALVVLPSTTAFSSALGQLPAPEVCVHTFIHIVFHTHIYPRFFPYRSTAGR